MVVLETPDMTEEQKAELKKAKDRERKAKSREQKKKAVEQPKVIDSKQIALVIATMSAIISSRPEMSHWMLSPEETNQIATPLATMMAKNESFKALAEHSDGIGLAVACATIFIPRMLVSAEIHKRKKEVVKIGNIQRPKHQEAKVGSSGSTNDVTTSNDSTNDFKDISSLIPSLPE